MEGPKGGNESVTNGGDGNVDCIDKISVIHRSKESAELVEGMRSTKVELREGGELPEDGEGKSGHFFGRP